MLASPEELLRRQLETRWIHSLFVRHMNGDLMLIAAHEWVPGLMKAHANRRPGEQGLVLSAHHQKKAALP